MNDPSHSPRVIENQRRGGAARGGAQALGRKAGTIAVGQLADLVIVPENPLANFKVLYGTGHTRLNREDETIEQVGGVRWTIKDGIIYDAQQLLADVARMADEQRAAAQQ